MKEWNFSSKILLVGIVFAATTLALATLGIIAILRLETSLNTLNKRVEIERTLSILEQGRATTNVIESEAILEENESTMATFPQKLSKSYAEWEGSVNKLSMLITDPAQRISLKELKEKIENRKELSDKIITTAIKGDVDEAFALHDPNTTATKVLNDTIDTLVNNISRGERASFLLLSRETVAESGHWIAGMSVFLAVGLSLGLFLTRGLITNINTQLTRMTENLFDSSNRVMNASQQIALSSAHLSATAALHAASLEETGASLEELTTNVFSNAEHAKTAAAMASDNTRRAQRDKALVERMLTAMKDINTNNIALMDQANHNNLQLNELVKVMSSLAEKNKVIKNIVFQTKLLSFNAAVEAARAGEHGKRFAIVAEDLAHLAKTSSNTSRDLSNTLDDSIRKVQVIVSDAQGKMGQLEQANREKIEQGQATAEEFNIKLNESIEHALVFAQMAGEISSTSWHQATGIAAIKDVIGQLGQLTQQSAATSEQCAASAQELTEQSESIKSNLRNLTHIVKGHASSGTRLHLEDHNEDQVRPGGDEISTEQIQTLRLNPNEQTNETRALRGTRAWRSSGSRLQMAAGAEDMSESDGPRVDEKY